MLLADSAQAVDGKLYILGGGWSVTGPDPTPSAIALKIEVPWDATNRKHSVLLQMVDIDDQPVTVETPIGEQPIEIKSEFEVGRPPGVKAGTAIDLPMAINLGPLPLPPGNQYVWKLSIDDESREEWRVVFTVRPPQPIASKASG